MPRARKPDPAPEKPEPTPDEIRESHALSNDYLELARESLADLPRPPRRRPRSGPPGPLPGTGNRLLQNHLLALALFCRRGDCRRRGRCCHGLRSGDRKVSETPVEDLIDTPCLEAVPRAAYNAMLFAVKRRYAPTAFRQAHELRSEEEALRAARRALGDQRDARRARAPAGPGHRG